MTATHPNPSAPKLASIVIGGGLNNCTSSSGRDGGRWGTADWDTILLEDPAFEGLLPGSVQFDRDVPVPDWRYRLSAEVLDRLLATPAPLLGESMRKVVAHWCATGVDDVELSFPDLQVCVHVACQAVDALPAMSAADWAVLRSVAVTTPPGADRPRELRSVRFLSDSHSQAVYRAVVDAARATSGRERPRVGVLTSASEDPFADADIHVSALRSAGADSVYVPLDGGWRKAMELGRTDWLDTCYEWYANRGSEGTHAHSVLRFPDHAHWQRQLAADNGAPMLALLASLDGVFFAGGDQARHLEALGTAVVGEQGYTAGPEWRLICQRHAQGNLVVAGTSAGNHIQGGGLWQGRPVPMIGGGDSCPALARGFMPASGASQEAPGTPTLYPHGGLRTFPYGVLDSHFSQRCREGRLVSACLYSHARYGFGVDENTALLVEQPHAAGLVRMRVMGEHGVWVVDVQACQSTVTPDGGLQASGVCVHHLLAGDELVIDHRGDLHVTLTGVPDATAVDASLTVDGWQAIQAYDSGRFAALAQHLCRVGAAAASGTTAGGNDGRTQPATPPWVMRLRRRPDTRVAWQGGRAAYASLELDVWPLQPVTLAA